RAEVTEMGWDKKRYYTRSKKVCGRVVREYVGTGPVAVAAARLDAIPRERRGAQRAANPRQTAGDAAPEERVDQLDDTAEGAARAALVAAGYHQHKRGEWRKRRGQHEKTC